MKKLFLVFTLLTSLAIFSACALTDLFNGNKLDKTSFTGILTEQSSPDEVDGSHLLTDGGDITPLRSLTMNLSSRDYLNNKVSVTGKFNLTDEVFEVTGITVNEILSPDTGKSELTDYQNVGLGFKLKYYSDWTIEENPTDVIFTAPEIKQENATTQTLPNTVTVEQIPFNYVPVELPPDGPADDPLASYCRDDAEAVPSMKPGTSCTEILNSMRKKIGVDMLDALRIDETSGSYKYYVYRDNFIYKISFILGFDPYKDAERTFEEMVTSFQFIGMETGSGAVVDDEEEVTGTGELPAITMELAPFNSTNFGFSAVYPKKWYYSGSKPDASTGYIYQYAFSDKADDDEGLIKLRLSSKKSLPDNNLSSYGLSDAFYLSEGPGDSSATVLINVPEVNYTFEVTGPIAYKDLIINLSAGIKKLETNP